MFLYIIFFAIPIMVRNWVLFLFSLPIKIMQWFYIYYIRPKFSNKTLKDYQEGYLAITGATGGIESELAKQFAEKGFKLILIDQDLKELETLRTELLPAEDSAPSPSEVHGDIRIIQADFAKMCVEVTLYCIYTVTYTILCSSALLS